jgi:hypothetical protein
MTNLKITFLFLIISTYAFGQSDSCWTVLLIDRGKSFEIKPDMAKVSKTGFYLYRNCNYDITLKNGKEYGCRLIDIKPDTLFIANCFNENVAKRAKISFDTLAIHYKELDKLRVIADRSLGWYEKYSFDNFDFQFKKDTGNCKLESYWEQIFSNDNSKYEIAPHLSAQGITYLFEENGLTYFFYGGGMSKPDRTKMDTTYDCKNVAWFTPNYVEKLMDLPLV